MGADQRGVEEQVGRDPMRTEITEQLKKVDVAEVYSPSRITAEARKFGMTVGKAMDLTTGWDFRREG